MASIQFIPPWRDAQHPTSKWGILCLDVGCWALGVEVSWGAVGRGQWAVVGSGKGSGWLMAGFYATIVAYEIGQQSNISGDRTCRRNLSLWGSTSTCRSLQCSSVPLCPAAMVARVIRTRALPRRCGEQRSEVGSGTCGRIAGKPVCPFRTSGTRYVERRQRIPIQQQDCELSQGGRTIPPNVSAISRDGPETLYIIIITNIQLCIWLSGIMG